VCFETLYIYSYGGKKDQKTLFSLLSVKELLIHRDIEVDRTVEGKYSKLYSKKTKHLKVSKHTIIPLVNRTKHLKVSKPHPYTLG
jgi:hypothetical protein